LDDDRVASGEIRVITLRHARHEPRTPLPFDLPAVTRKKLTVVFAGGNLSSDGGLLMLRQAEAATGVCMRLSHAMPDARDPTRIIHEMIELVAGHYSSASENIRQRNARG
jgi:Transposase DDE domain group 1